MQNRRTTAQINAQTLARLKNIAKERNLPLYVLLDEAVLAYLNHPDQTTSRTTAKTNYKNHLYELLMQMNPVKGKNKWVTTGIGLLGWYLYTVLPDN